MEVFIRLLSRPSPFDVRRWLEVVVVVVALRFFGRLRCGSRSNSCGHPPLRFQRCCSSVATSPFPIENKTKLNAMSYFTHHNVECNGRHTYRGRMTTGHLNPLVTPTPSIPSHILRAKPFAWQNSSADDTSVVASN